MSTSSQPPRRRLFIADTTLRDGEQSPGAAMTVSEKVTVAHAIAALGVDVLEAGFPAASPGEFDAVQAVGREVGGPIISAMARCHSADIDRCLQALETAPPGRRRVHAVLATSPIHREHKLKLSRDEVLLRGEAAVRQGAAGGAEVQFSAEDATRTELDFLDEVVAMAVAAGATTVCLPDTVGWAVPEEYAAMFRRVAAFCPGGVLLAAHCHNDLGLAVANSLAACQGGATQVECTLNGIGERAGNTSLEEFATVIAVRADYFGYTTPVRLAQLYPACHLLTTVTGLPMGRNKPVVGRNVFTTAAGIHQDGLLKNAATYEIISPDMVGAPRGKLTITKHSGRAAVRNQLHHLGVFIDDEIFKRVFEAVVQFADAHKEVADEELLRVAAQIVRPD